MTQHLHIAVHGSCLCVVLKGTGYIELVHGTLHYLTYICLSCCCLIAALSAHFEKLTTQITPQPGQQLEVRMQLSTG